MRYTLDDLEELVEHVAAAANHAEDTKLRKTLDALFARLGKEMVLYDDGVGRGITVMRQSQRLALRLLGTTHRLSGLTRALVS